MSRICVKNLPKYVDKDRLKTFFSERGEITDVKLMHTKDGKSRQFGFVGYRTEQEAQQAIGYFNNTFMDTCRITCEIARKVGDPDMPSPWSRYSLKKQKESNEGKKGSVSKTSGLNSSEKTRSKKNNEKGSENDDPQLHEFLELMQPRSKSKLWANDAFEGVPLGKSENVSDMVVSINKKGKETLDRVHDLLDETNEKENGALDSHVDHKLKKIAHDEVVSDLDYFKSRVKKDWSDSESGDNDGNIDSDDDTDKNSLNGSHGGQDVLKVQDGQEKVKECFPDESDGKMIDSDDPLSSAKKPEDELLETNRLFIHNFPYTATEVELEEHFSNFGKVSQVHIVKDKYTKQSKGIAYVLYALPESAARALDKLDNSIFQGRLLHVMPAKNKNPPVNQENIVTANQSKTFKQKREEERKASEASGNTQAWNSLFMRSDTVVENIARKFGVSKSDFLDREANDLAVRIALGETQVIAETKKALGNAGVNIDSLEEFAAGKSAGMKRSNHVLLVKNLPYSSSEGELVDMFGMFGSLDKIILPPSKTLALVVFLEPAEARAAFRQLAYKRYKDGPLYLEWAPGDILSRNLKPVSDASDIVGLEERDAKRVLLEQHMEATSTDDVDSDRVESRTLFVKNLNFKTSDEILRKHFCGHVKEGVIQSARVKKHLKNGKNISMGFGFVEFDSVETATNVCRDLQGTVLDGHALILQLCHAKKDEPVVKKVEKDRSSTKLIVRNVAFEATDKDLRQLFSPFGQIKSVRLPMRFGSHRGFAFVEYVTKQEAQNALEALANTHLYGRHLVMERAKEGESLEELRARTAAQFTREENGFQNSAKLSKKRKHLAVLDGGDIKFQRIVD